MIRVKHGQYIVEWVHYHLVLQLMRQIWTLLLRNTRSWRDESKGVSQMVADTLIKATLSNLLVLFMFLFNMAKSVERRLEAIEARFMRSDKEGNERYPLVNWETTKQPRGQGSLGIKF